MTREGAQQLFFDEQGKLFIVQWDAATTNFVIRRVSYPGHLFEHSTFAPINLPDIPFP